MILMTLVVLAAAEPLAPVAVEPPVYEVEFPAPNRAYASLGPVGPYYPQVAHDDRQDGVATLRCRTGDAGALEACDVVSETPPRYDFGIAAVVMARRKYIRAAGSPPAGQTIIVRVPFVLPGTMVR